MAITRNFEHGDEPTDLAYRKRLWVLGQFELKGWSFNDEAATSAMKLDNYFFKSNTQWMYTECEQLMAQFLRELDPSNAVLRGPADRDVLSWVKDNDRRFFRWAFTRGLDILRPYLPPNTSGANTAPLHQNSYVRDKDKLILWFDSILGNRQQKKELESQIKAMWHENLRVNKLIPGLGKQDTGYMQFFWEQTLLRFEGTEIYQQILRAFPGIDKAVGEEDCYYAAMSFYDLSDLNTEAKKDTIKSIKKKWQNDTRKKKQVNVSLSPTAAEKLDYLSQVKGIPKSEVVERWILHEEMG